MKEETIYLQLWPLSFNSFHEPLGNSVSSLFLHYRPRFSIIMLLMSRKKISISRTVAPKICTEGNSFQVCFECYKEIVAQLSFFFLSHINLSVNHGF